MTNTATLLNSSLLCALIYNLVSFIVSWKSEKNEWHHPLHKPFNETSWPTIHVRKLVPENTFSSFFKKMYYETKSMYARKIEKYIKSFW